VSGRRPGRAALVLWALAGAACSIVGGDRLTDAQQVIADMKIGSPDPTGTGLTIVGAVDHADRRYRVGEPIGLSAEVSKPAHIAVLRVMPSGATTLIFPNSRQPSAAVPASSPLRIPPPETSFAVTADKPGTVLFEFIAASEGTSWLFSRKPEGAAPFVELGATTRALAKDIMTSLKPGRSSETAAIQLTVRITAP
jgi:uncharacterized protein DUF4384